MPARMANTGPPMTGSARPSIQQGMAMHRHSSSPGPLSFQCFMSYFLSFGWVPLSYRKISIR